MTEIQRYRVLKTHPGFELRQYEPFGLVAMQSAGDFNTSSYNAFRHLAGFISGKNQARQEIAMTAPVLQRKASNGFEVAFVMPANVSSPPLPLDPRLAVRTEAGSRMVAIRFSGSASEELFEAKRKKLFDLATAAGYEVDPEPIYARYNGPWTPTFLRRNEVLLQVLGE